VTDAFNPTLRRSPSGKIIDFGIDTDQVQNLSTVPGASVTDALDVIFARRVNYLDLNYNPVALWNFDDTLTAVRGPNFTSTTGPYAFCDVYPGVRGLDVGLSTRLQTSNASGLVLLGDMSVELLILLDSNPTNTWLIGVGGAAGTGNAVNNVSWSMILPVTTPPRSIQGFWESGVGTGRGFTTPVTAGSPSVPPIHNLMQLGFTRSGFTGQCYLNGRPFGSPISGSAAPQNGSSGIVTIGARAGAVSGDQFQLISAAVYDRTRTAAEWKESYNRSIGNGLGFLT
jgi:hypothetical protein